MPFYEWSDSLSVGVPLIDSDHQTLIGFINELHDSLEAGDEVAVLGGILGRLVSYIGFHFSREEKVIEACGYPHPKAHKEGHEAFTLYIHEFQERYEREAEVAMARELLDYLKTWLDEHILVQDKAYKKYTDMNPSLASEVASVFGPGLTNIVQVS